MHTRTELTHTHNGNNRRQDGRAGEHKIVLMTPFDTFIHEDKEDNLKSPGVLAKPSDCCNLAARRTFSCPRCDWPGAFCLPGERRSPEGCLFAQALCWGCWFYPPPPHSSSSEGHLWSPGHRKVLHPDKRKSVIPPHPALDTATLWQRLFTLSSRSMLKKRASERIRE